VATQSVIHSVEQQKPAIVVPIPKLSPKAIMQADLSRILSMRQQIEAIEEQLNEAETSVRVALESGADVEAGLFRASLKTTERRNVAWKSVVERELGEDYSRRVLAATKPDSYTTLVVSA
jgi:hypothetical protein